MRLTFIVDDVEEPFGIDVDPSITLEDLSGLLEIELRIPANEQQIFHNGLLLSKPPESTLASCGINSDEMMELRRRAFKQSSLGQGNLNNSNQPSSSSSNPYQPVAGGDIAHDLNRMRLQMLGDPALMSQIRATNPELAAAAEKSPERFAQLMRNFQQEHSNSTHQRRLDEQLLNADPFDIEAQRRIEEHIRQERVWENMQHAIEFSPESFGRVTMLYVDVEVNGHPVKAFVDSGAQMTIMSPECAQTTGIMRLIDERFSGIARGVGTAKILGRVHSAQLKLSDLHLPCSFTIMEGKGVDLLFGLDMLKRHQAIIDLSKNALIIQGRELRFLNEHELPAQAREEDLSEEEIERAKTQSLLSNDNGQKVISDIAQKSASNNLTSSSTSSTTTAAVNQGQQQKGDLLNEDQKSQVNILVGLGASEDQAKKLLISTGWNVDLAASLLFSQ